MKQKGLSVRTVLPNGVIEWRNQDGELHREDGPAKEWPARSAQAWYRNGRLHRANGPAVEGPEGQSWFRRGKRHREDGPAVIRADGTVEWYRNGTQLTAAEVEKKLAEIGDAFMTGLNDKAIVSKPLRYKTSQRPPR